MLTLQRRCRKVLTAGRTGKSSEPLNIYDQNFQEIIAKKAAKTSAIRMVKMERTVIKNNFVGFAHRVTPLQNVFHKECADADLNTDVLQFLSGVQNQLVGKMMDGACAISQHRRSKDVAAEDLLYYLDTQWNLDPLLMSANCIKSCYRVTETADKIDLSLSPESVPRKRRKRCSSNLPKVHPASLQIKKKSARKSKRKSKCDQSTEIIGSKSKVKLKSQDVRPEHQFKIHPLFLNKNPELKAEKQFSTEMSVPNSLEFLGNKHKLDACNDGAPTLSAVVPFYKPKSKTDEKTSNSESSEKSPPFKGKAELKYEIPVGFCFDPEMHNFKIAGVRQDASVDYAVPKSPICKLKSKVEQLTTFKRSMKVFPFKEKTKPEPKTPTHIHFEPKKHTLRIIESKKNCSEQSHEAGLFKPKSNIEKMLVYKHSTNFPLKEKPEPEFELAKQASIEMPCPDSQVLKISGKKSKQKGSGVKYASVKTVEEVRQTSVKMHHPDSCVCKSCLKRRKQEVFGKNNIPVETREAARRRLAIVLLRIAGKY